MKELNLDRELFPDHEHLSSDDIGELKERLVHATNHKTLLERTLKCMQTSIKGEMTYWEEVAEALAKAVKDRRPDALQRLLGEEKWAEPVKKIVPLFVAGPHINNEFENAISALRVELPNFDTRARELAQRMFSQMQREEAVARVPAIGKAKP